MRYLSKWGRLMVQVRPMAAETYANGIVKILQEPIYAQFEPTGVLAQEREMALTHFSFEGWYQQQDEASVVPPDYRIGVYDTDAAQHAHGWSNELRMEVESHLRSTGERFGYILEIPETFVPPPWPNYDDFKGSPAALVRKLVDEGHNLSDVLEYEQAHQERPAVVEAIEQAMLKPPVEEEVLG